VAGDVLARLNDTDAQQQVTVAKLLLVQAEMQTDGSITEAGMSFNDISVEQASLTLQAAQKALDELLNWRPDEDEIAQAQASLTAANAGYNAALGQESASSNSITIKQIDLESAQRALAEAEEAVRVAYDPGRDWEQYIDDPSCKTGEQYLNCTGQPYSDAIKNERDAADNAVQRAQENLEIAEANYNSAVLSTNSSSSANAQSSILAAELALKAAQEGPSEDVIEAAKTAVRQAELA
jgi:multidrug resistance efflux pump